MGLISRVSSRTYRCSKIMLKLKQAHRNFPFILNSKQFPNKSLFKASNPPKLFIRDYFSNSHTSPDLISKHNIIDIQRQKYQFLSGDASIKFTSTENAIRAFNYVNDTNLKNPESHKRIHTLKNHKQQNRTLNLKNVSSRTKSNTLRE